MKLNQVARRGWKYARMILLALLTPLLEKNPSKRMKFSHCYVPMVLSMARVIVLLFAAAMLYQVRRAGVAGWPEATLCIAIVLAMPMLSALERVSPADVVAATKSVFRRFGEGATRQITNAYAGEPSKHDDHVDDSVDRTLRIVGD
jgi:hypothetical protein